MVAEEGELRLDAPAAPGGVLTGHASDQVAKLGVELRAANRAPHGFPPPVELGALAVPGQDGSELHDDETGSPARRDPREPDPEDSVPRREVRSANGSLEDRELTKREVFKDDGGGTGPKGAQEGPETDHDTRLGFLQSRDSCQHLSRQGPSRRPPPRAVSP